MSIRKALIFQKIKLEGHDNVPAKKNNLDTKYVKDFNY